MSAAVYPLLFLLATSGCGSRTKALQSDWVEEQGTRVFDASTIDVVQALRRTFEARGYELAEVNRYAGTFRTAPREIGRQIVYEGDAAHMRVESISWSATLEQSPDGTVVQLSPRLLYGEEDVTGEPVWDRRDLSALWMSLFDEIAAALE